MGRKQRKIMSVTLAVSLLSSLLGGFNLQADSG